MPSERGRNGTTRDAPRRAACWLFALSVLAGGCSSSTAVTRNVGGRLLRGRFITDDAYAAYLRGALLEAQGQRQAALSAYIEGARQDPDSPELLTRIGALRCVDEAKSDAEGSPGEAFDRAASVDPAYEEAWTERARCHLKRGELDSAEHAARVAVSLDPDRIEPVVLLSLVLERRKRTDEAGRWLDGLVIRDPVSVEAQEAMVAFATRTNDVARKAAAERALASLGTRARRHDGAEKAGTSLADVDAALGRGAFDEARRLAISARLSSGAVALRAAAIGAANFAKEQAELVLAADPADTDARVAVAVAADLLRDDEALARAWADPGKAHVTLSPLAGVLLAELLDRRVGASAKKAWLDALGVPPGEMSDPLVRKVALRH